MTDNNPIPDTGASTAPATDAFVSNLDAQIDAMFDTPREPIVETADLPPEDAIEVDESKLEGSTEDDAVEGGSDTDDVEETKSAEEELEDTPVSVVDWDEMQEHSYQIGDKAYTANDLKAALGRLTRQKQDRTEVETARKEVANERSKLSELTQTLNTKHELLQHEAKLASYVNHIRSLEGQREKARKEGNQNEFTRLQMELEPMVNQYHKSRQDLDKQSAQNSAKNISIQKTILKDKGYGEILADKQRRDALSEYIKDTYSDTALGYVTNDADLIILAEKARLYDKAQSKAPKAKLKGSGRTLKGGATKSRPKNSKPTDQIQDTIDKMFEGL